MAIDAALWAAALWAGLANDPLVVYRGQPGTRIGSLVADRAGGSLSVSLSSRRWLQIGMDLAVLIRVERGAVPDRGAGHGALPARQHRGDL
jgi:hypothetical protein